MEYLTQKRLSNKHEAIRPLNYPRAFAWINNLIIATEGVERFAVARFGPCRLLNLMSMLSFLYRQIRSEVRVLIHNQDRFGGLFILPLEV